MITRSGIISAYSPVVTGLKRTSDLFPGMFVYGTGLCPDTNIKSVDSASQVTLTNIAGIFATELLQFTGTSPDVYWDMTAGQKDIYDMVYERGDFLKVIIRDESDVSRDSYNSILKRNQNKIIHMKAFPIIFQPNVHQIEKAGLRATCDAIAYTPYLSWIMNSIEFEGIEFEGRSRVILRGGEYEIKEKGMEVQLADSYGYITLGLFKA